MSTLPFLAFFAPLALFFQQTRTVLVKMLRVFIKKRNIPYDLVLPFYQKLASESLILNLDDYVVNPVSYFSKKYDKTLPILMKMYSLEIFLYRYFIPIFVTGNSCDTINVHYLKFTFDFEKTINSILHQTYNQIIRENTQYDRFDVIEKHGRSLKELRITAGNSTDQFNSSSSSKERPISELKHTLAPYFILRGKIQNKIIGHNVNDLQIFAPANQSSYQFTPQGTDILCQVEKWLKYEKWYQQRNIPWKRGICLHGRPGNGKSSLVLEIARKLQIPLYVFDLSSYDNTEFSSAITQLTMLSAIVLFEDFDTTFDLRTNITASSRYGSLTFDYFLNKLSGANPIKNKFIFVTTNNLEKLDSALLRPGRMDEVIEIFPLENAVKRKLAEQIIGDNWPLIEKLIIESDEDSTAQFEKRCIDVALSKLWSDCNFSKI